MARTHQAYPREIRQQLVEMVRAGRTPEELAQEYEPSAGLIRNWARRASATPGSAATGSAVRNVRSCAGCAARTGSYGWSATS